MEVRYECKLYPILILIIFQGVKTQRRLLVVINPHGGPVSCFDTVHRLS